MTTYDIVLTRHLAAPRRALWRCWTEPALLMQWFCPKPWRVSECEIDLRPGGIFRTSMAGPDGAAHDDPLGGSWLEVVPTERLAFTNMLSAGWQPVILPEGAFGMTAVISFGDTGDGGTAYEARVLHADQAGRDQHAAMGFDQGWGAATLQLEELARSL